MKIARRVLLPLLVALPLLMCSKGDECNTCSVDADCNAGFVCSNFDNGGGMRCGRGTGTTTCRVRQ